MSLINRTVDRALADAKTITDQDADALTEITVRRLPGSIHWQLLIDGTTVLDSPSSTAVAEVAIEAVRHRGGRATVIYQDFNSMTERMDRAKRGQETANNVSLGWKVWVRWSAEDRAHVPCAPSDGGALLLTVVSINWSPLDNLYSWHDGTEWTTKQEPHAIVHVVKPGE